jgi:KEOPS complex subunit Cgi121
MITVFGARGYITDIDDFLLKLQSFSKQNNLLVQVFDARVVYGTDHLLSAMRHAQRAFHNGTNATNSLPLEILLYAAGERQIHKAIKKIGIKLGKQPIAFVLIDARKKHNDETTNASVIGEVLHLFHLTRDDTVLTGNRDTLTRFGITAQEIRTLPEDKYGDLILEKIAMVDIIK